MKVTQAKYLQYQLNKINEFRQKEEIDICCFAALTAYIFQMQLTLNPQDEISISDIQKDNKTLIG